MNSTERNIIMKCNEYRDKYLNSEFDERIRNRERFIALFELITETGLIEEYIHYTYERWEQ